MEISEQVKRFYFSNNASAKPLTFRLISTWVLEEFEKSLA